MAARKTGLKANGTLKKGYRFKKGGGVVKAKASTSSEPVTFKPSMNVIAAPRTIDKAVTTWL